MFCARLRDGDAARRALRLHDRIRFRGLWVFDAGNTYKFTCAKHHTI